MGVRFEMLLPSPDEDSESIETPLPQEKAHPYVKLQNWLKCCSTQPMEKEWLTLGSDSLRRYHCKLTQLSRW